MCLVPNPLEVSGEGREKFPGNQEMTIRSKSVPRNSFIVLKLTQHLPILSHATSKHPAKKRVGPNNIASSGDKLLC